MKQLASRLEVKVLQNNASFQKCFTSRESLATQRQVGPTAVLVSQTKVTRNSVTKRTYRQELPHKGNRHN